MEAVVVSHWVETRIQDLLIKSVSANHCTAIFIFSSSSHCFTLFKSEVQCYIIHYCSQLTEQKLCGGFLSKKKAA
jgi:hypothetical protein